MKNYLFRHYAWITGLVILLNIGIVSAQESAATPSLPSTGGAGDLLIAPTRIVLEGRTRSAEIVLNNKGAKEATYRVSLTHLQMQEDGGYKEITPEEAKSLTQTADELVRYSPRQVTLKPGESQIVKVIARKPEGLNDGEYLSHVLFRAVPDLATGEDVEAPKEDNGQISIRLIPVYGVSIPLIVRQGDLSLQIKLDQPKLEKDTLTVTINRTGSKSAFGDLVVMKAGTKEVLGQVRGVSVLAYNNKRIVKIPLSSTAGPFIVEYREREDDGGNVLDSLKI